jgi:predicted GNAT family N-acyltransferase
VKVLLKTGSLFAGNRKTCYRNWRTVNPKLPDIPLLFDFTLSQALPGESSAPMQVCDIEYGSELYKAELALRDEMLRKPLGLEVYAEASEAEIGYRHFGIERDGAIVACLMCVPLENNTVKIRQMAVLTEFQGTGLGRRLMEEVEAVLRADGIGNLVLNARHTAIGFYEKLGYSKVGDEFIEVGIPHWRMEKTTCAR